MKPALYLAMVLSGLAATCSRSAAQAPAEPAAFFRQYAKLSEAEIVQVRDGKALAKVLDPDTPDQVFVMGAVRITGDPEKYLEFAGDLQELRKLPGYLSIRQFSTPPRISDLDGFALSSEDIKDLQHCKPDDCEVQLPAHVIEEVQRTIQWQNPKVEQDVNQLTQRLALEALRRYQSGGNLALGTYRDKKKPTVVAEAFQALLARSRALPVYLPELRRYLVDYPQYQPANIRSEFVWENVNFGLKPTLRMVQAVLFRGTDPAQPAYAVAIKQLYSSHYFQTALDLTVCFPDGTGYYLITLKGSQQAGLTGIKGSILRKIAVEKSRSSLERALTAIQQRLEAGR